MYTLEEAIVELLACLQEKHPNSRAEGWVKIVLFSDGHGTIYDGPISDEHDLFDFSDPKELAEWLESGDIPEPTERE